MLSRFIAVAMILLSSQTIAQGRASGQIEWLVGDLPPFAWKEANKPRGYGVDLIAAMAGRMGRSVDISPVPWARAVATTREGDHYGVLPLARTPDREDQFRWLIKLTQVRYTFFAHRKQEGAAHINDIDALRTRKIGVLRGSPIINNLQAGRFTQIVTATNYNDLLRLLELGAIDAAYAGQPMFLAAIRQTSFPENDFVTGASLGSADLYLGASLKLDGEEAERWVNAYKALLNDGTVAKLRRRYDLPAL